MMTIILPKVYSMRKWADDMQEGLEIALLWRQTEEHMAAGWIGDEEKQSYKDVTDASIKFSTSNLHLIRTAHPDSM